jgi:hypothetical protein
MKPKTLLKLIFLFIWAILLSASGLQSQTVQQSSTSNSNKTANQFANTKLTYKIIDAPNNTFGYDIYVDNRKLIHQPSTPAVAGNEGFKTKADAVKVAKIVIGKMKKGEWPPAVTVEEMKKLKVIK